jgi:ATP-dependent helicase/nuclease subunit A
MTEQTNNHTITFTDAQRRAITTLGGSLCVTAGAGSGKTTVLVERYLHLIEVGGMDVPEIVAITFTEKAANQMKEKIREKIKLRLGSGEDPTGCDAWENRYREIGSAWIHTIHGFCTRLLKEYPVEAGIDPHFTMLDETESVILSHRIISDFVHDRLNRDAEAMVRLLTAYGLANTREMFAELLRKREAVLRWAPAYLERSDNKILAPLRAHAEAQLHTLVRELQPLSCPDPSDRIEQLRQEALELFSAGRLQPGRLKDLSAMNLRGGSKKSWGADALAAVKAALSALKDAAKSILPLFDDQRTAPELNLLRDLLGEFRLLAEHYGEAKSSQGMVDFDDLLILARDLLTGNPKVREQCRSRFKTILIDELQDTDPLQMEIVHQICGEDQVPVFAVGDAKQSIYSFRGADVSVFQRFQHEIKRQDERAVIPLNTNFRSQREILTFINHLFERIFPTRPESPDAVCFEALQFHKPSLPREHFVESCFTLAQRGEISATAAREEEAAWIASRIRTMVEQQEVLILDDAHRPAPVRYGDVALLFRAMTDVKLYEQALRSRGIPFTVLSGAGFFDKQEVLDILNLLRILVFPDDEEALIGLLRSPVIGLKDDTLFFMTRDRSLKDGLAQAEGVEEIPDSERAILVRARTTIEKLRRVRDRVRLPELIGRFLDETATPALLLTDPIHGHQRYANLKKLMDLARDFAARPAFGLSEFIDYIGELREKEAREGESPIDEESRDTVRILTVHKAKGLEFPVVFLPDLGRRNSGRSDPIAIDAELGIGIKVPDDKGGLRSSCIRTPVLEVRKRREIDEEKRLFYVACTRARDFLVLSGQISFSNTPKKASTVAMDWLKEALEITEDNFAEDLAYGNRIIKASTLEPGAAPAASDNDRWVDRHPEMLRGEPVAVGENPAADALIRQATSVPAPEPPTRFTVSQLLHFRKCPRGYELSGRWGIAEPPRDVPLPAAPSGGRELGSLVHGILQRWDFEASTLDEQVERTLRRTGLSQQDRREMGARAVELIRNFSMSLAAAEIRRAREVHSELPFLLKLDRSRIEGTIDNLHRNPRGRLVIIDYKTDQIREDEVSARAEDYRFQLAAYALAASRLFQERVDAALVFLHPGITWPLKSDPDQTKAEILSLIRHIQTETAFQKNEARCPQCGYFERFCAATAEDDVI